MISAKQAKEQSLASDKKIERDEVEAKIKKLIKAGKSECFVKENLYSETIECLEEQEFSVKKEQGRTRISWG